MSAVTTPTNDAVFDALGGFIGSLLPIDPATQIIRGLNNRTSMPVGGFVLMTELSQTRLSTNVSAYNDPGTALGGTRNVLAAMQYAIQIDCYGPDSGEWAATLVTMLRDQYGCDVMAPDVQPLYADDAMQAPLVNGEEEYERRWIITAQFQYNPVTTIPQQFAGALTCNLVEIDATFNP